MLLFLGFIQLDSTGTQAFITVNTVHPFKKDPPALPYCPNLRYAKPTTFFWALVLSNGRQTDNSETVTVSR